MLQVEPYELKDMTLIVALKTETSVVIVADGMGYSQGEGSVPYNAQKLHIANKKWVLGFCGWAGIEVHRKQLEAQIAGDKKQFDPNIDIGAGEYIQAICDTMSREHVPPMVGKIVLAGCGIDGLTVKVAELYKNDAGAIRYTMQESPDPGTFGSQHTTARSLIQIFRNCCETVDNLKELACFAIWRVSAQELTVGQMERGYELSACVLGLDTIPSIEVLPVKTTLNRMRAWQKCLERSCSELLSKTSSIVL
jgi:hypothetical protein